MKKRLISCIVVMLIISLSAGTNVFALAGEYDYGDIPEPNNCEADAYALHIDDGYSHVGGDLKFLSDRHDYFKFTLTQTRTVTVEFYTCDASLFADFCSLGYGTSSSQWTGTLSAGTYYLHASVGPSQGNDSYDLHVTVN